MAAPSHRLRSVGALGWAAAESLFAWLLMGPPMAAVGLGASRLFSGHVGQGLALIVLGVVVVGVLGLAVARALAESAGHRLEPGGIGQRGWLDARSWAWVVLTLTLRALVSLVFGGAVIACLVVLAAPVLVAMGNWVDIGPWRITNEPAAVGAVAASLAVLAGLTWLVPGLEHADRASAGRVLVGERGQLQAALASATSSRTRILEAHDQERRRIERDLHDGVQPELLGVSMTLGLALATMSPDDPARALVSRAQEQSLQVLESLRRFVRGIHPQVLDDHGLVAALGELTGSLNVPVDIVDLLRRRLPAPLETTIYYATAELLTNLAKHSQATRATVMLERSGGSVWVRVDDDGRGGADADGPGLTGVRDRLVALGGGLEVHSPASGPTTITVHVPLEEFR